MSEQRPLLIELGTEELPVKALPGLAQAFFDGVLAALDKRGVAVERGDAKPLHTPRRVAVLLPGVAVEQPEQASEVLGPYLNIALDGDGQPTRALQGFAAKAGVDWTQLGRTADAKGERFVHRAVTPGATTAALLPEIVREAIAGMPIPKPMRWGDHDHAFARPVLWLVMLLGKDVVDGEVFGVKSDRFSRGHRFLHDKQVWISSPDDYIDALRGAKVLVDADERRRRIVDEVNAAAKAVGGTARIEADNLEQVVCLNEWPKAVSCTFEEEFLAVPQEALVATMEANQKFFPVLDDGGRLTARFIGIANVEPKDDSEIRKGYERVIRPRFADAKFFFVEDMKQGLASMNDGLASVTYQAKLGTVADKVQRVAALAEAIAPQVGVDAALAKRAALLSKADLQSRLVGEFPELQGIAGRHYAMQDASLADLSRDDRAAIANAIDESWQPRFAGDDIALSPLGKVLAIAERLDTLAGGFAAGLKPTGNKDAFALRRNALGLARTIIESGFEFDIQSLLALAIMQSALGVASTAPSDPGKREKHFANTGIRMAEADALDGSWVMTKLREHSGAQGQSLDEFSVSPLVVELQDFILDRLRGYYADKGVPGAHFNAVAELKPKSLYDFDRRIDAIGIFAQLPEAEALAAANKRINNILKKAEGAASREEIPAIEDKDLLREPAESALAEAVEAVYAETGQALAKGDYVDALAHLARLRPQVDAFFDSVMVNVEEDNLRRNRLALLKRLADRLGSVAAIEHLST
ncbi:glycine--tRNA ligase subunit beta [Luteimonas aestuarii]|uniref:Glycine--tRNA ligase beta subunit n=1 Tax=Luteimonas aestuarii TaxID=453837 RepID=A0A4R5TSP1_9GAMM|nr:glycine--tRNA ligase subunit beta [Luteimonas aestuarii]TDK19566.1 glycine--tRNA ligase subunit beta [Luteimonas aestuarii]